MNELAEFFVHEVKVKKLSGHAATGPVYDTAKTVACFVDHTVRMVRNPDRQEVISTCTVFASIDDADKFTPGSDIKVDGRDSTVIAVNTHTLTGDWPEHVEVFVE